MLHNIPTTSAQSIIDIISVVQPIERTIRSIEDNKIINVSSEDAWRCHQGLSIRIRMINNSWELYCLCPPGYYEKTCQYQNERISLTIQIRAMSDWLTFFTFVIILYDNERNIQSHDYIDYLYQRDCSTKFNIYLLYSQRPKNLSKTYFIEINLYNKIRLNYRSSWLYPIQFLFLPVQRLSILLKIPIEDMRSIEKCFPSCIHGQCFKYINWEYLTYCQCNSGWSGIQCNIKYICNCSSNSLCIDKSICLCPLNRYGTKCYLHPNSCEENICLNDGQCIPSDERYIYIHI